MLTVIGMNPADDGHMIADYPTRPLIGSTSGEWHIPGIESPRVASRLLLHRLMVPCPVTGVPVDTGFELSAIPMVSQGPHQLVDCLECGQGYSWAIEDAFLD